jgi:hypothetical protein
MAGTKTTKGEVTGAAIVHQAEQYLGDPYVYGAAGPTSFDCSGLVQYTLAQLGVQAPRTSQDQWAWVKRVPASQVTAGDLVFFTGSDPPSPGHVGIVTAPGQMIDAPYTGQDVQVDSFDLTGTGPNKVVGFGRIPDTVPGPAAAGGGSLLADLIPGLSGLTELAGDFTAFSKAVSWLSLPTHWTRIFAGIFGAGLLGAGVYLLGKEATTGGGTT